MEALQPSLFDEREEEELACVDETVRHLIARGALFVVSHSGGKDSQAMFLYLREIVPPHQILVVHAILEEVEWDGVLEHVLATTKGFPVKTVQARRSLLEMIEARGKFPSPKYRQCTSDLKRGPIEKLIRHTGAKLIVSAMGMRKQESSSRSKLSPFKRNAKNSVAGREWYDWLPIHSWTEDEVFAKISQCGQKPHWAYQAGMTRLSCCFCIMSSKSDMRTAALLNPQLFRKYVALEQKTGQVMVMPSASAGRLNLEEFTGVFVNKRIGASFDEDLGLHVDREFGDGRKYYKPMPKAPRTRSAGSELAMS